MGAKQATTGRQGRPGRAHEGGEGPGHGRGGVVAPGAAAGPIVQMAMQSTPDPLIDDLNVEQREAVSAPAGPLLVLAGAGSGKTRVLTRRLAYLIREGADPMRLMAITFTNKAAREMTERVAPLLGARARGMWVHTFHSACARLLRREITRFGYTPHFTILDADDQRAVVRESLRELQLDEKRFAPVAVLGRISRAKQDLRGPDQERGAAADPWSRQCAAVYERYQSKLEQANSLDFDDLIVLGVRLLEDPEAGAHYREQFRHVLVDEYQDTNHAQYRLVRALVLAHRSITAVGDEDQSIYRFRGADAGNILRFEEDFPDARVVRLERNYRSTQVILDASGSVIGNNDRRYPKRLWTDRGRGESVVLYPAADAGDEAMWVARQIRALRPQVDGFGDFAVLYRTRAQSRALEEALLGSGLPYVVVGDLRFYDRKEVKDALAYLRLLSNPMDWASFRRAVATPRRGVGDATLAALAEHMAQTGEALPSALEHAGDIPGASRAAQALAAFAGLLAELRALAVGTEGRPAEVAEVVVAMLDRSGLYAELQAEGTEEARARYENLGELVNVARQNGPAVGSGLDGLAQFLEQAALIADADNVPSGEGAVVCLTLHAAKGLEFPCVFLTGMEEGLFPHSRALEDADGVAEERRLCYVGMTRAKQRLFLSYARERSQYGGAARPSQPSRFLNEIDPATLEVQASRRAAGTSGLWTAGAGRRPAPVAAARAAPVRPLPGPDAVGALDLRAGDRVSHHRWGDGVVVEGASGANGEVTVDFPAAGRRVLVLGLARLQRV